MPAPITSESKRLDLCLRCGFKAFYISLLFFSLHWAVVLYINSSYLEQFFSESTISGLFVIGAILTLFCLFAVPRVLKRLGSVRLISILVLLEGITLIGMGYTHSPSLALIFFIAHQAIAPTILFSLDIIMEGLIGKDEGTTGARRGLFLTIASLTLAVGTLCTGFIVGEGTPHFSAAYILSTILLICFHCIFIRNFNAYTDATYPSFNIREGLRAYWKHTDLRNVFFAYFLLQFFFAWMVIYTPVFLYGLGFNWEEIGTILFVGLMAYVLLEYPVGYLADTYIGEKEMMALGFAIIAVSVSYFLFLDGSSILKWMVVLFMTRVGASLVETTAESYFFKHTKESDASTVALFRMAQPWGYIFGPILGGVLLLFFPFSFIFIVLSVLMIPGLFFAMALHDTK